MPAVELPNGASAIIIAKDEITERQSRNVSRSFMVAGAMVAKLTELGFDQEDASTWGVWSKLSDEEQDNVRAYEISLITNLVKSWSFPTEVTADSALELPKSVFDALVIACSREFNKADDFSPDGVTDPKVLTEE